MARIVATWVVVPYAGEGMDRLDRTVASAHGAIGYEQVQVYMDRDRRGLPWCINHAVRAAKKKGATHVCWLSTGDTLHPERFSYPLPESVGPETRGQCCLVNVESRGVQIPDLSRDWQQGIYSDNQFCGSGMVVPVTVWDAVGGFDEGLRYCSDWDFAVKVQHRFGWECVGDKALATANEYADGLTKRAVRKDRDRDRATVAKRARQLGKGLWWPGEG